MEHNQYRHELKYKITRGEALLLSDRLSSVMELDPHAGPVGSYLVSSIYFDNCYDKALREKVDGVSRREKYRIRFYNNDLSHIRLERKAKNAGLCAKQSCPISREECALLLENRLDWASQSEHTLLREFYTVATAQLLRPKTMVIYERTAFVYVPGNVRVTFDRNIRSGLHYVHLSDLAHPTVEALPSGQVILEVKYDEFLPEIIRMMLQVGTARVGAFSKYAACRTFE